MKKFNILLASQSQRRTDILKSLGFKFKAIEHNFNENIVLTKSPKKFVEKCALGKTKSIKNKYKSNTLIIGVDTVVFLNGKIIGKPHNKRDAIKILKLLSDKKHFVYSGISLFYNDRFLTDSIKTCVKFKKISNNEINTYIKTASFHDKAGAYAIQEEGAFFIEKINGDYFNIVGFPVSLFIKMFFQITGVRYYEYFNL